MATSTPVVPAGAAMRNWTLDPAYMYEEDDTSDEVFDSLAGGALGLLGLLVLALALRQWLRRRADDMGSRRGGPRTKPSASWADPSKLWATAQLIAQQPARAARSVATTLLSRKRRASDDLPAGVDDALDEAEALLSGGDSGGEPAGGIELRQLHVYEPPSGPPTLRGSTQSPPTCLSAAALVALRAELPPTYALRDWTLLYSTEQHGCSTNTFWRNVKGQGATLLVVLDSLGHRFGAFVEESWRGDAAHSYFGNGETFLYSLGDGDGGLAQYGWSRADAHFVSGNGDCIAFGSAPAALYLDAAFERGSSHAGCPTYANETLAGSAHFTVTAVEVWGLN